jgi:molybdopterin converting factor small subunit
VNVAKQRAIEVDVKLMPPLKNTAGCDSVKLSLAEKRTIQGVIDALMERFDSPRFRHHLYDTEGRIIPAWCVFVNERPFQLNSRKNTEIRVEDGDEITFLLNLAGG